MFLSSKMFLETRGAMEVKEDLVLRFRDLQPINPSKNPPWIARQQPALHHV